MGVELRNETHEKEVNKKNNINLRIREIQHEDTNKVNAKKIESLIK